MYAPLVAECAKLSRSLVLLLCISAPSLVALMSVLALARGVGPGSWAMFATSASAIWAYFMLPMTVTALTVLVAQIEHGSNSWNHLLALPVPRWKIYAAKAAVVIALVAGMTLALWLALPLAGTVAEAVKPSIELRGRYDWAASGALLAKMFASAVLLIVLQLWVALRFRSFVPPLVLGIGGTFVGVAATGSEHGIWFPWLIPTNALASDPVRAEFALSVGVIGGAVAVVLMLVDLSRREMA